MKKWILFLKDKWRELIFAFITMLFFKYIFVNDTVIELDQMSKYIFGGIGIVVIGMLIVIMDKDIQKKY